MRILCLDLATVTGFAFGFDGETPEYGSERMGRRGCTVGECFIFFDTWLEAKILLYRPEVIVFEAPILFGRGSVDVVQRLMGLAAIAELIGLKRGLTVYRAEGSTIIKAFTGKARYPGGRTEKKKVTIETCRRYGWDPKDDNAADALACLHYAHSIFNRQQAIDRASGPLFR